MKNRRKRRKGGIVLAVVLLLIGIVGVEVVQVYGQISRQSPCIVTDRVRVSIAFHHGDLRRRDSDNGTSSILDLMVDCGILKDDCGDYNEGVQNAG